MSTKRRTDNEVSREMERLWHNCKHSTLLQYRLMALGWAMGGCVNPYHPPECEGQMLECLNPNLDNEYALP